MRVISGTAKGRKLKRVPGDSTRPIMDRVKESLFNIVGDWTIGARWYDMFGGTGAVGIEALSRGATEVIFTDNTRAAIRTIHDNLKHTRLDERAKVRQIDAFQFVREYRGEPFDLIYVAPPQYKSLWREALLLLDEAAPAVLLADGIIVVQIDPREYEVQTLQNLALYDQRTYGTTMLCFYDRPVVDETIV